PFNLTGILYFPKLKGKMDLNKNKIQLYCNQVFVTDSVEGIVPEFLTLLHGVIDSPDIPLNVSRSYLQSDSNVKKISGHISKKVSDKLEEMFKKDRKDFEEKWDDIQVFMEYGMITEDKFYDRTSKISLFKNTNNEYFIFDEYKTKIEGNQTNKDGKLVILYTNDTEAQHSYITAAKDRDYDVLVFNTPTASHFIGKLEQKLENVTFVRVDSNSVDKLIEKDDQQPSKLSEEQQNEIKPVFEEVVSKDKFSIQFESLSEKDAPITIVQPEFMRRMKEMSELGGGGFYGDMPETYNMIVNANHPLIGKILVTSDSGDRLKLVKQVTDLALLSQNMLKGEALTEFVSRNYEQIGS
ncbi:MAG: molecular chaperone HtpG, partial [Flavobacteriales bacterium]|nr:molecular chaperone HtpG [Flavobacteriales bacterium]